MQVNIPSNYSCHIVEQSQNTIIKTLKCMSNVSIFLDRFSPTKNKKGGALKLKQKQSLYSIEQASTSECPFSDVPVSPNSTSVKLQDMFSISKYSYDAIVQQVFNMISTSKYLYNTPISEYS